MTFRVESPVTLRHMPTDVGLCHYPLFGSGGSAKGNAGGSEKIRFFQLYRSLSGGIHVEDEQEERVRALYDIMHKELYEFFRSELMEKVVTSLFLWRKYVL